jgi:hypothetical protein
MIDKVGMLFLIIEMMNAGMEMNSVEIRDRSLSFVGEGGGGGTEEKRVG